MYICVGVCTVDLYVNYSKNSEFGCSKNSVQELYSQTNIVIRYKVCFVLSIGEMHLTNLSEIE